MIDVKILCFLLGRAMFAMAILYLLPTSYAILSMQNQRIAAFFLTLLIVSAIIGTVLSYNGRGHRQRIKISESAATMILVWPLLTLIGSIPFIATYWLSPFDAILETVSNLTAAGLSFLPSNAPYVLQLWQALLMWLGSFVFLSILVTILPEVSGCFGMELSLSQGQIFSPMLGQMRYMAKKILLIYETLTALSFAMFKLAGLDNWDAISMAMRCISTGGGEFFPGRGNIYVEYAAMFSMLLACGNFLLYFRLFSTIFPPESSFHSFFTVLKRNIKNNIKIFLSNSEVQFLLATIFIATFFITFTTLSKQYFIDGNFNFRAAIFHVVSYLSTTGITISNISEIPNYDRFLLFLMVVIGGCMGSATGGLKIIRIIVLFKLAIMETRKVLHPRMVTNIKVNGTAVPMKIVGRVLSFFFLCSLTLFIFSVILSLSGQSFSTSVAMSLACLTNIGPLPGICDSATFMALPAIMKLLCCMILIVGRMEIFAFLILLSLVHIKREKKQW